MQDYNARAQLEKQAVEANWQKQNIASRAERYSTEPTTGLSGGLPHGLGGISLQQQAGTSAPRDRREIEIELDRLVSYLSVAQQNFYALMDRIRPILNQNPPKDGDIGEPSPPSNCTLGGNLHNAADEIARLAQQLAATTSQIEL
jgi:hypothetical protein